MSEALRIRARPNANGLSCAVAVRAHPRTIRVVLGRQSAVAPLDAGQPFSAAVDPLAQSSAPAAFEHEQALECVAVRMGVRDVGSRIDVETSTFTKWLIQR